MSHKYILNCDNVYWRVKFRIGKEKYVNKCFRFALLGGKRKSLKLAIDWRDARLAEHNQTERLLWNKSPDIFGERNHKQPFVGVCITNAIKHSGIRYNWTAKSHVAKRLYKRSFSIKKYGYKQAFLMACEYRYRHSGTLRKLNKFPYKPSVPYIG